MMSDACGWHVSLEMHVREGGDLEITPVEWNAVNTSCNMQNVNIFMMVKF